MSTSLRFTPSAHRKNKLVTRTNGSTNFRSVRGADGAAMCSSVYFSQHPALLPSGQRSVQMHVPAVHEPMLASDVSSLLRKQKDRGVGDLRGLGHSGVEWNLRNDLLEFFFRIGKRAQPLPVERRHH